MSRTERVQVKLPLTLDTAARLMRAVGAEWPGTMVVTDHGLGDEWMVFEVTVDDED
jgi:hypothetical protein